MFEIYLRHSPSGPALWTVREPGDAPVRDDVAWIGYETAAACLTDLRRIWARPVWAKIITPTVH